MDSHYQKCMDSLNFYKNLISEKEGNNSSFSDNSDNCSDSCISSADDQKPFTIQFYITRSGEILDVDLELVWWDPEQHNKKFSLNRFHKCESITLPKGNKHCCYRLYAQRKTDGYVNTWANISNSSRLINIDVSKSGDNIYYNTGNTKDRDNTCNN
jgi:hypothetical protein